MITHGTSSGESTNKNFGIKFGMQHLPLNATNFSHNNSGKYSCLSSLIFIIKHIAVLFSITNNYVLTQNANNLFVHDWTILSSWGNSAYKYLVISTLNLDLYTPLSLRSTSCLQWTFSVIYNRLYSTAMNYGTFTPCTQVFDLHLLNVNHIDWNTYIGSNVQFSKTNKSRLSMPKYSTSTPFTLKKIILGSDITHSYSDSE